MEINGDGGENHLCGGVRQRNCFGQRAAKNVDGPYGDQQAESAAKQAKQQVFRQELE